MDPKDFPSTIWQWESKDNHAGGFKLSPTTVDTITMSNTTITNGGCTLSPGYGAVPPNVNITTGSNTSPYTMGGTYSIGGAGNFPNTLSNISGPYTITGGTGTNAQPWFSNSLTPKIRLDGEGADIEVNGWSLIDAIKKIEDRLNILHPNTKLEEEWEELRALGEQYRKLEQHIKDKQATWDKLKAMPPPEID